MCELVASWSEDESRKVGAVIVGLGNETVGVGFNGLPREIDNGPAHRHDKMSGEKYLWYEHAERNALYNTIRAGGRVVGATMFSSGFPCADCARAIIQTGISVLKTFKYDLTDPVYSKHFTVAEEMLLEAGVDVQVFDREDLELVKAKLAFHDLQNPKNNFLR
jgi:dCMP deaminase